ncbi:MAG: hypothetical protein EOP84_18240 [Verrucomicrobiaceae bacterium]|nr:MAG: hypothetical protein EOP84_18240 [Verrucomicrobiaceae bacterium]
MHPVSRTYVLMPLPRRLDEKTEFLASYGGDVLPLFIGGGGDNLMCGECFFMIAQSVESEDLRDQRLFCPKCSRENALPRVGDLRMLGQETYPAPTLSTKRPSGFPEADPSQAPRAEIGENSPVTD